MKNFAFSHSKIALSFNILLVLLLFCLRNMYWSQLYQITPVSQCSFLLIWYGAYV